MPDLNIHTFKLIFFSSSVFLQPLHLLGHHPAPILLLVGAHPCFVLNASVATLGNSCAADVWACLAPAFCKHAQHTLIWIAVLVERINLCIIAVIYSSQAHKPQYYKEYYKYYGFPLGFKGVVF